MLNRIVSLGANQEVQVRGDYKRVIIRRASGPVRIETDKSEVVEARQGDNIYFEKTSAVLKIQDLSGYNNRLVLIMVSGGEGDLTSVAEAVEIANVSEIVGGARDYEIRNYDVTSAGTKVLSADSARRTALITTAGECQAKKSQNDVAYFTVDGVLEHSANGELWLFGSGRVEVMEYFV